MSRKSQLQLVANLSAELDAMSQAGDWRAAADRVVECQRLLANCFLGDRDSGDFDADDRALVQRILNDNQTLLRQAEARRRELAQAGIEMRRNRRAVSAYAWAGD